MKITKGKIKNEKINNENNLSKIVENRKGTRAKKEMINKRKNSKVNK